MATLFVSRYSQFLALFVFVSFFFAAPPTETLAAKPPLSFSFDRFEKSPAFGSEIALYGDAEISDSVIRITRPVILSSGRIVYRKPIRFTGRNPGFKTYFSFSISPGKCGALTFSVVPISVPMESRDRHLLGPSSAALAVKFDALMDPKTNDSNRNHVEIDISTQVSVKISDVPDADLVLNTGEKLHSWIDYDGDLKRLEVRLSKFEASRPSNSSISCSMDLSGVLWKDAMYVSISSSSEDSSKTSSVYSWSFAVKHAAPYLMHSEPVDPRSFLLPHEGPPIHLKRDYLSGILVALFFGVVCGALVTFVVLFVWSAVVDRRPVLSTEYPVHPAEFGYEKIVFVEDKRVDSATK